MDRTLGDIFTDTMHYCLQPSTFPVSSNPASHFKSLFPHGDKNLGCSTFCVRLTFLSTPSPSSIRFAASDRISFLVADYPIVSTHYSFCSHSSASRIEQFCY